MYSMMMERECKGKYYSEGHFEEFESGTFLGFGIDYEEFESGPAQYTTAIVELKDGKVIITTPDHIQFIHCRRGDIRSALSASAGAVDAPNDEIPSEDKKDSERESQELFRAPKDKPNQEVSKKTRQRIVAEEMHMTKAAVATAISTYKKKSADGGNS